MAAFVVIVTAVTATPAVMTVIVMIVVIGIFARGIGTRFIIASAATFCESGGCHGHDHCSHQKM
jgi:hypothetical protein